MMAAIVGSMVSGRGRAEASFEHEARIFAGHRELPRGRREFVPVAMRFARMGAKAPGLNAGIEEGHDVGGRERRSPRELERSPAMPAVRNIKKRFLEELRLRSAIDVGAGG